MTQLFTNQATNGVSEEFDFLRPSELINVWVAGNLGGGTVTIEASTPDSSAWVAVSGGVVTEAQMVTLEMAACTIRLNLTGATTPNVNAWVKPDL